MTTRSARPSSSASSGCSTRAPGWSSSCVPTSTTGWLPSTACAASRRSSRHTWDRWDPMTCGRPSRAPHARAAGASRRASWTSSSTMWATSPGHCHCCRTRCGRPGHAAGATSWCSAATSTRALSRAPSRAPPTRSSRAWTDPELETARAIFLRLTELGHETPDTRRRASLAELEGGGDRDPAGTPGARPARGGAPRGGGRPDRGGRPRGAHPGVAPAAGMARRGPRRAAPPPHGHRRRDRLGPGRPRRVAPVPGRSPRAGDRVARGPRRRRQRAGAHLRHGLARCRGAGGRRARGRPPAGARRRTAGHRGGACPRRRPGALGETAQAGCRRARGPAGGGRRPRRLLLRPDPARRRGHGRGRQPGRTRAPAGAEAKGRPGGAESAHLAVAPASRPVGGSLEDGPRPAAEPGVRPRGRHFRGTLQPAHRVEPRPEAGDLLAPDTRCTTSSSRRTGRRCAPGRSITRRSSGGTSQAGRGQGRPISGLGADPWVVRVHGRWPAGRCLNRPPRDRCDDADQGLGCGRHR